MTIKDWFSCIIQYIDCGEHGTRGNNPLIVRSVSMYLTVLTLHKHDSDTDLQPFLGRAEGCFLGGAGGCFLEGAGVGSVSKSWGVGSWEELGVGSWEEQGVGSWEELGLVLGRSWGLGR